MSKVSDTATALQAKTLGFQEGEKLWVRAIAGKGYDVDRDKLHPFNGYLTVGTWRFTRLESQKRGGGVKSVHYDGLRYLKQQNSKGYGIYLVPNKGGRKDEDITEFTSFFFECDDTPKDEQWERIERLPIQPSMVVETRKSLHIYYALDGGSPSWRKDQQRLIQLMDSDRTIHNESRLMRLAGFDHMAAGVEPFPINIVYSGNKRYKRQDFVQYLPEWDERLWSEQTEENKEEIIKRLEDLKSRRDYIGTEVFPLEICLTKRDRERIEYGVPKGSGYHEGFKLACNLIATEEWLRYSGFLFSGTAESLFQEFAARSSDSYHSQSDIDRVFSDAKKTNPTPSLSPDAMEKCIGAWRYKEALEGNKIQQAAYQNSLKVRQEKRGLERLIERLNNFIKGGYHLRKIEPLTTKGTVINHLPDPEEYQGEIVEFNEGEGANLYQVAARMGYKYILDNSPTGSGKTYTVGQLQADSFHLLSEENPEFTRIIYCSQSTRNPNSAEIESKYYEFPSRNDGFVENLAKFTPGGKPTRSIYNPEKGISEHEVRLHGNCDQIAHFANAYKAGHSTKGFCGSCPHFEDCKKGEGNGYGYLSTAQDFLHERYIRANLGSIPVETIDDKTTLIIDESEVAEWVTPRQIDLADVNFYKGYIKKNDPEAYAVLIPFIDSFMDLFDESNNPAPAYGWTYPELRDKLYVTPEIMGLVGKIQQHEINSRPSLEELEKGAKIHPIWLSEVISILGDLKQGSLSATNNNLTITIPNKRVLDSISNAGVRILQDATHSRTQLSQALGVKEEEILVVRQVAKAKSNVKITQLAGVGKLGNQRSQDEINRAIAIRKHYIAIYGVLVGFTDYKAHAEKTDLIHGGDARGSNLFKDKKVVVSLGVYRPNMGACLNEYIALTGNVVGFDDEGFQEYYGHKQASNIIQELGRLRANRRLDEELEFVIAADVDTSFLEDLGYNVEVIDAVTINSDFCNKETRVKARNIEKGKEFVREFGEEKFKECTQKDFANFLGLTPQAVNNWIKKHLGGCWQKFKDMVLALMNPQPTPDHKLNEADLSEVQGMRAVFDWLMGVQVTDALFASEFKGVVECFEWRNVLEGIRRLPLNLSYRLLFRIIRIVAIDDSV